MADWTKKKACPYCGHRFSCAQRVPLVDPSRAQLGERIDRYACPACGQRVVACHDCRTRTWTWDKQASLRG